MIIIRYSEYMNTLNEGVVSFRQDFIIFLKQLNSKVAKLLREANWSDVDMEVTSIEVGDQNDEVLFWVPRNTKYTITYPKYILVPKYFSEKYKLAGIDQIPTTLPDDGEIVDIKKIFRYSELELPKVRYGQNKIAHIITAYGREYLTDVEFLQSIDSGKPQPIKVGRLAQRLLSQIQKENPAIEFTQKDIADFVEEYKAYWAILNGVNLDLIEGEEIKKYYHQDSYDGYGGTLSNSCMRYPKCQAYFNIYTQNPDVCKLLVLFSGSDRAKISARALIWTLVDGKKFMDRIYGTDPSQEEIFKRWAQKNNCLHKIPELSEATLAVKLKNYEFDKYPYLDTLCWFSYTDGVIHDSDKYPKDIKLNKTNGSGPFTDECSTCEDTGNISCRSCSGGDEDCPICSGLGFQECPDCG